MAEEATLGPTGVTMTEELRSSRVSSGAMPHEREQQDPEGLEGPRRQEQPDGRDQTTQQEQAEDLGVPRQPGPAWELDRAGQPGPGRELDQAGQPGPGRELDQPRQLDQLRQRRQLERPRHQEVAKRRPAVPAADAGDLTENAVLEIESVPFTVKMSAQGALAVGIIGPATTIVAGHLADLPVWAILVICALQIAASIVMRRRHQPTR